MQNNELASRLQAVEVAIKATLEASNVDRKAAGGKSPDGHYTKALTELNALKTKLRERLGRAQ